MTEQAWESKMSDLWEGLDPKTNQGGSTNALCLNGGWSPRVYIYIYMCKPGPSMNLVSLSPQKIARLNDGQENIQGNRSPAIQGFSWHKRNLIAIELWVHQFKVI